MKIRLAAFGDEHPIADILEVQCRGKSNGSICRSRAHECVKRGGRHILRKKGLFPMCLVALDGEKIVGILFALELPVFELYEKMKVVQVGLLCGRGGRELLGHLRGVTVKRILITGWSKEMIGAKRSRQGVRKGYRIPICKHSLGAFKRWLQSMKFKKMVAVGTVFEI